MNTDMPNEFDHFVQAQRPVYNDVVAELKDGHKTSHWIWYIFPQIKGLGFSIASINFAIQSLEQAKRYLNHPLLGQRLHECTQLVLNVKNQTIRSIFGNIDAIKFCSCMTLFSLANPEEKLFKDALQKYFSGKSDQKTIEILQKEIGNK